MNKYNGACLCGNVTFEIEGEFESFYLCHCSRCRKDTGSAHAANLFSKTAKLSWLSGSEKVKVYRHASTLHVKSFCSECGSSLPSSQMEGQLLVVPAGSLDTKLEVVPNAHIYTEHRAAWDDNLESVRKFGELPSG